MLIIYHLIISEIYPPNVVLECSCWPCSEIDCCSPRALCGFGLFRDAPSPHRSRSALRGHLSMDRSDAISNTDDVRWCRACGAATMAFGGTDEAEGSGRTPCLLEKACVLGMCLELLPRRLRLDGCGMRTAYALRSNHMLRNHNDPPLCDLRDGRKMPSSPAMSHFDAVPIRRTHRAEPLLFHFVRSVGGIPPFCIMIVRVS